MSDHSTLDSRLKKYAALATGITAVSGATNAQVQYTDINPDYLVSGNGSSYALDLNNDNVVDFEFVTISSSTSITYSNFPINVQFDLGLVYPAASSNSWMANSSDTTIANIPAGSSIAPSNLFSGGSAVLGGMINFGILGSYPYGNFLAQEGFLGVKFQASGNTHYGWIRVEVTADGKTLSVKDYAYDATPNTAIVAGETGSGPVGVEHVENSVKIQNINNQLMIELNSELTNCIATVTSITGQQVVSQSINNAIELIELNDLSKGIYVVSVNSDQGMVNKKIYIR